MKKYEDMIRRIANFWHLDFQTPSHRTHRIQKTVPCMQDHCCTSVGYRSDNSYESIMESASSSAADGTSWCFMFLMIFSYPLKLHNFEELNSLREKSEWKNLEKTHPKPRHNRRDGNRRNQFHLINLHFNKTGFASTFLHQTWNLTWQKWAQQEMPKESRRSIHHSISSLIESLLWTPWFESFGNKISMVLPGDDSNHHTRAYHWEQRRPGKSPDWAADHPPTQAWKKRH